MGSNHLRNLIGVGDLFEQLELKRNEIQLSSCCCAQLALQDRQEVQQLPQTKQQNGCEQVLSSEQYRQGVYWSKTLTLLLNIYKCRTVH